MEQPIAYLDYAATTPPCEQAIEAAVRIMRDCFGNPSSLHTLGVQAARELSAARESVAALLGCEAENVCFTSGGSEANNHAVLCGARLRQRIGRRVVSTAVEHSSVAGALARLEEDGWEVVRVMPRADGSLDADRLIEAVNAQTALVSVMQVNNETGAIFPVEQIAKRLRMLYPRLLIHCDGVQAFGKLSLRLSRTEIDLYSVSGHKIAAPKGVGTLYIRRAVSLPALISGGGQERARRGGTESLPLIAAFGAACRMRQNRQSVDLERVHTLAEMLEAGLAKIPEVCSYFPAERTPYIRTFSIPGWRGETMLHFLESRGVYVSSGSACSKGTASPVLKAMGLDSRQIEGALRVSFGFDTGEQEIERLLAALRDGIATVVHR